MKVLLILSVLFISACGPNYSNGDRIGVVTKLSEKGLIFKSWEGEMIIALPNTVSALNAERFTFNVDHEAVSKVKDAMQSGTRVKLVYRQWLVSPPTIDNNHVVIDVQPVQQSEGY